MENFNPEFIKRLAMGDDEAYEQIKDLTPVQRTGIGLAVDDLRRKENIIPASSGKMSIYAETERQYADYEGIGKALAERIQHEKEVEEHKEKIREEQLRKEVEFRVQRARAGLTYR